MKKFIASAFTLFVIIIIAASLPIQVSAADTDMDIRVYIDGEEIEFDVKPAVINQRTMVPMRFIFEYFGLEVEWNQKDQSIRADLDDGYIYMQLNSKLLQVVDYYDDNIEIRLDVAPCAINGRTLVPLRAIAELFNADVAWEQETQSVIITTPYPKNQHQAIEPVDPYTFIIHNSPNEQMEISFTDTDMNVSGILPKDYSSVEINILDSWYSIDNIKKNEAFSAKFDINLSEILNLKPKDIYYCIFEYGADFAPSQFLEDDVNIIKNGTRNEFETRTFKVIDTENDLLEISFEGTVMKVSGVMSKDLRSILLTYQCEVSPINKGEPFSVEFDLSDILNPTSADIGIYRYSPNNIDDWYFTHFNISLSDNKISKLIPPVYDHNYAYMSNWVTPSIFLKDINNQELIDLSNMICQDVTDDYEKILRIHDWVCENIYYDLDYYGKRTESTEISAIDVLHSKKTVCAGYSNLTQALIQAQNIPCRVVSGYALGASTNGVWTDENVSITKTNHAWNQAYVNNHWINIDTTWDSTNRYTRGTYQSGEIRHEYFDISLFDFSNDHKFLN